MPPPNEPYRRLPVVSSAASHAAAVSASAPMARDLWLTTTEICAHLAISRSTLFAIRRSGLLHNGRHLVVKNPNSSRSYLLGHRLRCELALSRILRFSHTPIAAASN
jgi:hypothetical protein